MNSNPTPVIVKTLSFVRLDPESGHFGFKIVDVTDENSPSDVGTINSYTTYLEINCPVNSVYAKVFNINEDRVPTTIWFEGWDWRQRVFLLEPESSQPMFGWLFQESESRLYDSAFVHPEFPHLTNDLVCGNFSTQ